MRTNRRFWVLAALLVAVLGLLLGSRARWPFGSEALAAGNLGPLSQFTLPAEQRLRFEGRVVERLVAGSYTYLQIEKPDGTRCWAVTLSLSKGARAGVERVSVVGMGFAAHFDSKRLGRSFKDLHFAVVRPL